MKPRCHAWQRPDQPGFDECAHCKAWCLRNSKGVLEFYDAGVLIPQAGDPVRPVDGNGR